MLNVMLLAEHSCLDESISPLEDPCAVVQVAETSSNTSVRIRHISSQAGYTNPCEELSGFRGY